MSISNPAIERKKQKFLKAHEGGATVCDAARFAGVHPNTPYKWKAHDPRFAEAWQKARETLVDDLEMEAFQRAIEGNDRLLIFLLKAYRPGIFSEKGKPDRPSIGLTIAELAEKVRQWL